jgi:uncharacterized repeat protein (TIGR01451 family)
MLLGQEADKMSAMVFIPKYKKIAALTMMFMISQLYVLITAQKVFAQIDCAVSINSPLDGGILNAAAADISGDASLSSPIDLMLILDTSGSLKETDPNDYRKQAVSELVNNLRCSSDIRIGVVDFDQVIRQVVPLTPINNSDCAQAAKELIGKLDQYGGTAIGEGIYAAMAEFQAHGRPGAIWKAILFSDGENTHGRDPLTAANDAASAGVTINTVTLDVSGGCSGAYPALMQDIATPGGGFAICTNDPQELIASFQQAYPKIKQIEIINETNGASIESILTEMLSGVNYFAGDLPLDCGINNVWAIAYTSENTSCNADINITREGEGCLLEYLPLILNQTDGHQTDGLLDEDCVASGDTTTYNICYSNPNQFDIHNTTLLDSLPVNTNFNSASGAGIYDSNTHKVSWGIGTLAAGASGCEQLSLELNSGATPGSLLHNHSTIYGDEVPYPTEAEEETLICPESMSMGLNLSSETDECVLWNADLVYQICFDNHRNSCDLHNVCITDNLPPEVSFIGLTGGGSYNPATHTVIWSRNCLPIANEECVQVMVQTDPATPPNTMITNYVSGVCNEMPSATTVQNSVPVCNDLSFCTDGYIDYIQLFESDPINDIPTAWCNLWISTISTLNNTNGRLLDVVASGTQINLALLKAYNEQKLIHLCLEGEWNEAGVVEKIVSVGFGPE